jgi:WD40 repeat protein
MAGSTVQVYSVNAADGSNGANLASTTTDSTGSFKFTLKPQAGPVRLVVSGGSFLSEADGATVNSPDPMSVLLSSVSGGPVTANVNPLTDFIDQMAVVNITYLHQSFSTALEQATSKVERVYGLSTDPSQLEGDYSRTGTDGANLGLILGAFINEDQTLCPESPGGLVTALATDLADGAFDGKDANGSLIDYCGGSLPEIAGTSMFQDALSGLQQLQTVSQGFAFGGFGNLLTTNGLADIATGGSISYPVAPLALINSAIDANAAPVSVNAFAASTPSMNEAREFATATLLPNGKVLIAGGSGNKFLALSSIEIYDPVTNTFAESTPSMNKDRADATSTLLPSGQELIAGGVSILPTITTFLSSTEIYDPATNIFAASTPSMNHGRAFATATLLPNGKVLIAGGVFNTIPETFPLVLSSTEIYDPATNTFAASTPNMNESRDSATATLLPNGELLIAGGVNFTFNLLSSTEIYDLTTNTFAASTPSMNQPRGNATATLLPNGKVLVAGGVDVRGSCSNCSSTASTEIYDPASNTFAASTPSMNQARAGATATLLPNGKVLIAGGSITFGTSTEIYDPATNTFAASTPTMNEARNSATATLLPNGKVLIAAGSFPVSSKEIYDPITNTFGASSPAPLSLGSATATLLPNGKVLIAGGSVFTIGFGPLSVSGTAIYSP